MKHVIKAGTDGATLCAFDTAALPPDIDERIGDDPAGMMEALQAEGRLWFGGTGGDGMHVVHVLVDESPSPEPAAHAVRTVGEIDIPGGRLWVCGAEYLALEPRRGSAFTPGGGLGRYRMGRSVKVPKGRYALETIFPRGIDGPSRPVTRAQWLMTVPVVMVMLGAVAAVILGFVTLVLLGISAWQYATGSPLAGRTWNQIWIIPGLALAGAGVSLAGLKLGNWLDRRLGGTAGRADGDEAPDVILRLTRLPAA
ncbi:hypothetical protein [Alsobacter sp. R-9]